MTPLISSLAVGAADAPRRQTSGGARRSAAWILVGGLSA